MSSPPPEHVRPEWAPLVRYVVALPVTVPIMVYSALRDGPVDERVFRFTKRVLDWIEA